MLNLFLYKRLTALFGEVKLSNEGQPLRLVSRLTETGDKKWVKLHGGEEYRVCCPFCGDKRFRLYVNHSFGLRDSSVHGIKTTGLVKCYNENCEQAFQRDKPYFGNPARFLEARVFPTFCSELFLNEPELPVFENPSTESLKPFLPFPKDEWCRSLSTLPKAHPAVSFAELRKFRLEELEKEWGVRFAERYPVVFNGKDFSWLEERLFIPTTTGWQARALYKNPFGGSLKYFSCPGWKKSSELYNLKRSRVFGFTVVVEGVTDVWRLGPSSVALFGKSISRAQGDLLAGNFTQIAVCLDQDASVTKDNRLSDLQRAIQVLDGRVSKVFPVYLPFGTDPADLDFNLVWDLIESAAAKVGASNVKRPKNG